MSQKINQEQANFSKTTDANGWTVYDYGTWKKYIKVFGPYTTASLASLGQVNLTASADMPVGVSPSIINEQLSWIVNTGSSHQFLVVHSGYDKTSTSTTYTYGLGIRNVTSVSLTPTNVYVTIELTTK